MPTTGPIVKCAHVVGDVIGKYHPHGDSAVYDTLVRMAQDFSMRYLLIDGQGNFGSIDGDPPAAYRYTECRLKKAGRGYAGGHRQGHGRHAAELRREAAGAHGAAGAHPEPAGERPTGIAVGMATNIPPHNLGEVVDGVVHLIDHPEATVADLMTFVKGPDFPTGGTLCGLTPIREMYETGRGHLQAARHARRSRSGRPTASASSSPRSPTR